MCKTQIQCGVSNRHIHVCQQDLEILFGSGYKLAVKKDLSQTGQYAAEETVKLVTAKSQIENVRILGPVRKETQVEISLTDTFKLGIKAPLKESGDLEGTPGILIVGPNGFVLINEGVIVPSRHLHMNKVNAVALNVKDKQIVSVKCDGPRSLIFNQVLVRVREDFVLDFHIDTDEANAAGLNNSSTVTIIS
ncbi:MAG: phosphate propanoyltransferase [Caldisericia bacterium]|nr:phosphate propanoyltransferase [Caldisericia bacterium]